MLLVAAGESAATPLVESVERVRTNIDPCGLNVAGGSLTPVRLWQRLEPVWLMFRGPQSGRKRIHSTKPAA